IYNIIINLIFYTGIYFKN
ncbi:hypothetical protein, partial [Fusobacterium nucleatum]